MTAVLPDDVRVRVGSGTRAHVFRPHPAANVKANALREGQAVFDIALCGARGELVAVDDDVQLCLTCESLLEGH